MSLARFALAFQLCGQVLAGEVAHTDSTDVQAPVARRLQGGYAQPSYGQAQPGYGQPYQNNGGYGGYGYGNNSGGSDSSDKLSLIMAVLVPICLLLCLCFILCQVMQCCCGGQTDPLLGAGLGGLMGYETGMGAVPGAVAGYEAGRFMDGRPKGGMDDAALGGLAGYEMGQYMGGPGGF